MEDNARQGLSTFATILLTVAIITVISGLVAIAIVGTKSAQDDISGLTSTMQQTKFLAYENSIVSGSQITNVIRQYMKQDAFGVKVTTGKNSTATYGNPFDDSSGDILSETKNDNMSVTQDQTNANYINPSGRFTSKVVYDKNGVVRGLVFTQR